MKHNILKALAEVEDILNNSEKDIQEKVPDKFKKMLENNKDKNYVVNIDYSVSINKQNLLQETREILALIYRDYLCNKEEKRKLIEENDEKLKEKSE